MAVNIHKLNIGFVIGTVGLAAGAPTTAVADVDTIVRLSGGAMQSDFTRMQAEDKMGEQAAETEDDFGLYGSIEVLRGIKPGWEWSASVSALAFSQNHFNDGDSDNFNQDFDASFVNFDIGRKWETSRTSLRLGVGVEAISSSEDKGVSEYPDQDNDSYGIGQQSLNYIGAGLRLSAEGKASLSEESPFSIYGAASLAATRGKFNANVDSEIITNPDGNLKGLGESQNFSFSDSENGYMDHSTLDFGLEYSPASNTAFRVGLRRDVFKSELSDTKETNTAYVGVSIGF